MITSSFDSSYSYFSLFSPLESTHTPISDPLSPTYLSCACSGADFHLIYCSSISLSYKHGYLYHCQPETAQPDQLSSTGSRIRRYLCMPLTSSVPIV